MIDEAEVVKELEDPRVRKPRKQAAKTPSRVKVINMSKSDVFLTGEEGELYRLHPRETGTCPEEEADHPKKGKHPHLEIVG